VKPGIGTTILVAALFVVFGIELTATSVGNETLLLKRGALPDDGQLHSEYWRLATYSFLHLNGTHLFVNASCYFGSDESSSAGSVLLALARFTFPACFAPQQ
jgi:membrane associated rhomboid family serine protease